LYEEARQEEEALSPYTMEEINARLDEAERQVAMGQLIDEEDIVKELENARGRVVGAFASTAFHTIS
jgi:hypothetical protein